MNYKITVNGVAYDVEVQPASGAAASAAPAAAKAPSAGAGDTRVEAQVAGKIFKIVATPGTTVSAGDPVVILEAMKMEIPVAAPASGVIASIEVNEGDEVEVGYLIATMN